MTSLCKTGQQLCIAALCIACLACASTPEPDRRPEVMQSAEKSLELGVSNYRDNNFDKAEAHFSRALFLYRNIDNPTGIIASCLNIAKTKLSSGQVESARAYAEQAQNIIQREQLSEYNDRLTLIQSSIAIEDGDTTAARQLIDGLLEKTQANGDHAIRTAALQNRTRIAFMHNAADTADWLSQYEAALKQPGQNTLLNRARLLRFKATLQPETGEKLLAEALELYREAAHSPGIAATLSEWGAYDNAGKAHENAIEKLQRALFIRANLHDRKNSQLVLRRLATGYHQLGNTGKAGRASYWLQQLDEPMFKQWDAVISEFEHYPD